MTKGDLPEFVMEKINNIHERSQVEIDEIIRDYLEFYESEFIQKTGGFANDEQRHRTSLMHLWKDYIARPPAKSYEVIPIGYSEARLTQSSKKPRSVIYAIIKGENGIQIISCMGTVARLYESMNLFCQYNNLKLGQFKDGDFVADSRTKFENPHRLGVSPHDLLQNLLKIPIITIKEAEDHLSFVRSDGFTNTKDWKCIRAMISRMWSRDEQGTYTIADDSMWFDDPQVTEDGDVRPPGFTCWTAPSAMVYEEDDECEFYGSIVRSKKDDSIQMNCFLVLPVRTQPDEPEPPKGDE